MDRPTFDRCIPAFAMPVASTGANLRLPSLDSRSCSRPAVLSSSVVEVTACPKVYSFSSSSTFSSRSFQSSSVQSVQLSSSFLSGSWSSAFYNRMFDAEDGVASFSGTERIDGYTTVCATAVATRPKRSSTSIGKTDPAFSDALFRQYLDEISRYDVLTTEQEVDYGRRIQSLMQMEKTFKDLKKSIGRTPSDGEWATSLGIDLAVLQQQLNDGREAKSKMVNANLRWVVAISKKYIDRGVRLQDLVQEGNMGLVTAAERFDPNRGLRFLTYATWWIRQAVSRSVYDHARTIRLPVSLQNIIYKSKRLSKELQKDLGRRPTDAEVATTMNITVDRLRLITEFAMLPESLDAVIRGEDGDDSTMTMSDVLPADEDDQPDSRVRNMLLRDHVMERLQTLPVQERDVLLQRYGLLDGVAKSLQAVSDVLGVSRAQVRRYEQSAMKSLRSPIRSALLRSYSS